MNRRSFIKKIMLVTLTVFFPTIKSTAPKKIDNFITTTGKWNDGNQNILQDILEAKRMIERSRGYDFQHLVYRVG